LYRETPLFEASKQLLESIITPIASDSNSDWLDNRIVVPPIASTKINPEIWEKVIGGLKGNRVITFDYLGTYDEEYQNRRVRPYQLLFDSGVWYLYGFSEERKTVRIFSLSRIKNAVITKDVFFPAKKIQLRRFFGRQLLRCFYRTGKNAFCHRLL
jgi:predicted DNA-binding transcriptional regulator YafY